MIDELNSYITSELLFPVAIASGLISVILLGYFLSRDKRDYKDRFILLELFKNLKKKEELENKNKSKK
jgi:hypothetical protein